MANPPLTVTQRIFGVFNAQNGALVGFSTSGEAAYQSVLGSTTVAINFPALRLTVSSQNIYAFVIGSATPGDGGGGDYFVNASSTQGAWLIGSMSGNTLTVSQLLNGAIANGLTLNRGDTGASIGTITGGSGNTWTCSGSANIQGPLIFTCDNSSTFVVGADGARWNLSGLILASLPSNLVPNVDNTFNLGSASFRWAALWAVNAVLNNATIGALTVSTTLAIPGTVSTSLVPTTDNTVALGSAGDSWSNLYVGVNHAPVLDTVSGNLGYYARTAAEIAASVTPTNFSYAPGDVRRYGAVGNGITNDQTAVQNALNVQQDVLIPSVFNCLVTGLTLQFDGQTLYGLGWDSQITCNGTNANAVTLSGRNRGIVRDLFIAYTGTTNTGLNGAAVALLSSSNFCAVRRCRLQGTRAGVTINTATNCWVTDNLIDFINPPDVGWDIAVYLAGGHHVISRNKCFGGLGANTSAIGTSGIYIISDNTHGCDWNIVAENEVGTHSQYGILLYANIPGGSAQHNTVTANIVHDITGLYDSGSGKAYGAGIYLASAEWTTVTANFLYNTNINTNIQLLTPGAIGVGGVSCFTITANVIRAPVWYGIYIATDGNGSGGGIVNGNVVTSAGKDGIFLSAISNVRVANNTVFGSTNNGISYTNSSPGTGISIQNNQCRNITQTGIVVTQIQCPNISGNYVGFCATGLNMTNIIGGFVLGNEFRNNTSVDVAADSSNSGLIHFDRNTVRSSATTGVNDGFGFTYGINDVTGQTNLYGSAVPYERVLATSATPSAAGSLSASYGGATAITDLLNGYPGQRITIRATGAITLNHNAGAASTKLINRAGANLSLTNGQTASYELVVGGPWFQVN